jgi:hypothetical protein
MSRFSQRIRQALADPEFAAGYWEADAEIEQAIAVPAHITLLPSSAETSASQTSVGMRIRISTPRVGPVLGWNSDMQLLGDRAARA